ncbi:MAG: MerR family transcriptional regulator [Proteobacteria bacterium]|nr:MerR family transcriptional regulator [Pseudomonadota bacterium]
MHFKIGEVARLVGVKPHVLRFWESEFGALRPQKTQTNQRVYRRREVELLLLIKRLLYQDGFTISGAKRRIAELSRESAPIPAEVSTLLRHLCTELRELVALTRKER